MFHKQSQSCLCMLSNLSRITRICNLGMTFFDVLAAFEACTIVLCQLLRGLATFSKASEGLTKFLAESGLLICGIYFCSCLFCCTTFLRRKLRNTIAYILLIPLLIHQMSVLELFSYLLIGIICIADAVRQRTR